MSIPIYRVQNTAIASQLATLNDKNRNSFFNTVIVSNAKNKIVLDLGTGTGLLAYYALLSGAEFVYCIEKDYNLCCIAENILSQHFEKSKFKVIHADFLNPESISDIKHQISMLVCDTGLPGNLNYSTVDVWNSKFNLSDDCIILPNRVFCDLKVWHSHVKHVSNNNLDVFDFYTAAVLDENFANSIILMDKTFRSDINSEINLPLLTSVIARADYFFPCIFDFSYNQQSTEEKICFEFYTQVPASIAIQTNIAHNNFKLYDHNNWKTQCQQGKLFYFENAGSYDLVYDKNLSNWFVI